MIVHQGDSYTLKNLAVQAGTLVNGNRIETVQLHDGDRVKISNYELTFHLRADKRAGESAVPAFPQARPAYNDDNSIVGNAAQTDSGADALIAEPAVAPSAYLLGSGGQQFVLRSAATTRIGRALDNDIIVGDASVSRHHASIEYRNGGFLVRDLGSQNGTWMDGKRVTEALLSSGDALRLGDAFFTFHA
jgi:pSer/pThr/pTyr-binding forkhead associated (FHA) protein